MSAIALTKLLQLNKLRIFTTRDVLTLTELTPAAATQALRRLKSEELLVKLKRGVWINRWVNDLNPYEIVPYLRAPWPAYVSLYSALADHGVISEIPHIIYGASSAPSKNYKTPYGEFHIHHLPENLMWGYVVKQIRDGSYLLAEPEKAFLDLIYLALTPRSPIELVQKREKKWALDIRKLTQYAKKFNYPPLTTFLKKNRLIASPVF